MPHRPSVRLLLLVAAAVLSLTLHGCGNDGDAEPSGAALASGEGHPTDASPRVERGRRPERAKVLPASCPAGLPACRSATGRIVYVERVDPDGDGDAHFVIRDPQGITLPGLTAIDVRKGLRPDPLPGPGDLISAAGPVQIGSYGQRQIHALELRVGR